MPERFTIDADGESIPGFDAQKADVLNDAELVDLMAAYTMIGDSVADAYAARMTDIKFHHLIEMLQLACDEGIDAVPDAPPELAPFIAAMANTPDWIDMDLVREGARIERNQFAHLVPFAIRGAFLATFMNRYSALPMALTGNLSDKLAAKRVHETATFFTLTVMPGALERHGAAFKAAAMVRLMHSMVRVNAMRREGVWDASVYGVPIPQVDQMPAGQIGSLLMASDALRQGRDFTSDERARIEIARYRCFLLGLPRELLGETPQQILRLMLARQATLRADFDDATCGMLVRGTLEAELSHDDTPIGRIDRELERSFARAFFIRHFLKGDTARAKAMGVRYSMRDRKFAVFAAARIFSQLRLYDALATVPGVRDVADRHLVSKLQRLLKRYGHAEFVSDGGKMREDHG
ncbi:DUF2236 domain-containing protein [Erythrobacter sp. YJ-T3-07]|uniref:oxygenase MpaB family protein n=1 Tax=Erythrobacter sp. YJ-T3-07 TaxID=2793063 RepID=UPI0018D2807B|nr:oxygenase MpaB family protein [Erythrobacter sp. YJ-T3-07]MBH1943111.1 DUF2236 domain-containing protein [Erythrobacter sp. YJ-T3-07]